MSLDISKRIAELRKARGLNQEQLSELALLSRVTIAKYESGRVEPGAQALSRIADALEVTTDTLLGRSEEQPEVIEKPFTVTPYDLRHSFATLCRDMTPPIEIHTVIAWMGHADSKMILKVYDSVTDERDKTEAERLREAFNG